MLWRDVLAKAKQPVVIEVSSQMPKCPFVDQILGTLGIKRVYEPLMVPIRYNRQPRVDKRRRRRWVRNDFYLPELGFFIEVYSGHCTSTLEYKQSRLRKLYRLHRIPYLLLTPVEWEILKINPLILREWIDQEISAQALAA